MIPELALIRSEIPKRFVFTALMLIAGITEARAQDYRPGLFLREDWAETPPQTPVTQDHVANEALELRLYGSGADSLRKSNHERPVDDPFYVWSGLAEGNWAVALRKRDADVDLSEFAKIVWRSKQSGLRCLRLIVKTSVDGWLVSGSCDGASADWRIHQFNIADVEWYALDIETIAEGRRAESPDLSHVEEIGFTDLMRGGGSRACSRLDWIEVYGESVAR